MPTPRLSRLTLRVFVALSVLLFLPPFARNQTSTVRDGNWWVDQDKTTKYSYMVGFFDGMHLGNSFSYWKIMEHRKDDPALEKVQSSFDELSAKYMTNVTNAQLVDGLDEFYADYRNRRILVLNGVWLVVNEISGKSKEEMEKMTESWRKNAVPPSQ